MPLINLHSHSYHSDGSLSVFEMASKAQQLGHCCYVLTDHDYALNAHEKGLADLIVSDLAKIPIIVGAEICTPIGECLMFGIDNIRTWIKTFRPLIRKGEWRDNVDEIILDYYGILTCPLIVCHPGQLCDDGELVSKYKNTLQLVAGYERQNCAYEYPQVVEDRLEKWTSRKMKRFYNSDAHWGEMLEVVCNKIEIAITTEEELINAINDPAFTFERYPI